VNPIPKERIAEYTDINYAAVQLVIGQKRSSSGATSETKDSASVEPASSDQAQQPEIIDLSVGIPESSRFQVSQDSLLLVEDEDEDDPIPVDDPDSDLPLAAMWDAYANDTDYVNMTVLLESLLRSNDPMSLLKDNATR
jgi:hypothetical protein